MKSIEILKRCEVFLGLSDSALHKIASLPSCREETYQVGEIMFREGDRAVDIHVLAEGKVSLVAGMLPGSLQPKGEVIVDILTKGGVCCWSALMPPHELTLSGICAKPSKVVAINGAELISLMDKEPHIGYEVMKGFLRVIGNRVRDLEQLLISGKRWPFLRAKSR
jgi:CRP-like cAMP-binding protein